ncbi:MAG: HNH endonuclease [Proteobacteria bacterium]|nr:HNH endonuclease [Pseudomonadota bacterium]
MKCSVVMLVMVLVSSCYVDAREALRQQSPGEQKVTSAADNEPETKIKPNNFQTAVTSYNRKDWGSGWVDEDSDCQDTRAEVLIAESRVAVTFRSKKDCVVDTGEWLCPFTGRTFYRASDLDVDHIVPLKEAHLSGGYQWSRAKKKKYANDLSDPNHLIAVHKGANRSKGARDIAQWLPKNQNFHQEYVKIFIDIKKTWQLSMDQSECQVVQSLLKLNLCSH